MNNFIVLYSGGMGSFLATYLLKIQNPGAKILLYFNDTKYEDPDLYRFLKETVDWLRLPLLDDSDGRSVWELFEDEKFVGNSRVDICSRVLKRDRSQFFIKKNFKPDEVKIVLGIDWTEIHRLENAKPHWEPYKLIAPLCDYKGDKKDLEKIVLAESGIKRPKLYDLGFAHNNCFAGETEFITDQGIKTLKEMVGLPLKVLGKHQAWETAEVKSFGEQQLYCLTVSRSNENKMIYTTLDHKWFRRKGVRGKETELVTTEQLLPGNRLVSNYAKRLNSQIELSAFGIAHGIVFGDGTCNDSVKSGYTNPGRVMLCGDKDRELLKYFPLSPSQECSNGIEVRNLPRYYKKFPPIDESKSYLAGWLAGYIAADGTTDKNGYTRLSSSKKDNLLFVKDVCCKLGIGTKSITVESRLGLGKTKSNLYTLYFVKQTMCADLLLISAHKERFEQSLVNDEIRKALPKSTGEEVMPQTWKVVSIEETDRFEEVYCAVVPGSHSFTLESNLLTSNCGGRCVKQGLAGFRLLYEKMPERYLEMETQQEETKKKFPQTKPFLKKQVNGVIYYLSLKDYREQYLLDITHQPTFDEQYDFGGCACAL